jgi:hypothetical protein
MDLPSLLYVAVPIGATAIIQGMGIQGGVVLADNKPVALRIASEQLFGNADMELIELALFAVDRVDLDPMNFVELDRSQNATGSYPYEGNIPPVALKLVEFYLISDDDTDDEDDIEVDLDVYGDFAKYL